MSKKFYIVVRGRKPGIYDRWDGAGGAAEQVQGFKQARFKGFTDAASARSWLVEIGASELVPLLDDSAQAAPSNHAAELEAGKVVIYTDGAAINNPGPGGYGAVLLALNGRRELSGGFRYTTNNRMELLACIAALRALKSAQPVVLFSDSRYVVDGITKGWAERWQAHFWLKSDGTPAENIDLWQQLLELHAQHTIEWRWVKGHAGTTENERCDQLAMAAARQSNLPIDQGYEQPKT